ncbi:MAG: efflux RND transporter permease subunit, partial [Chloroflexota bacterium]
MAIMILLGAFGVTKLNTQFFPTIEIPVITVSVSWPGASAEDVEKNIIDALEPEVRFLDGVDDAISIAREGAAVITLEYDSGTDMQKAQSDVEQAIARVTTLPEDSEDPVVSRIPFRDDVAKISIYGPFPESALKRYAKQIRDGLLDVGIDKVTLTGARSEEISVEAHERDLRRLNLTVSDLATRIRENTRDIPSGTVEGDVDIQLRTLSERKTAAELGDIEVRSTQSGEKVYLRDVARLEDRFDKDEKIGVRRGIRAIELNVQRALTADTLETMKAMEKYIAKIKPTLPPTLQVEVYDVRGKFVKQRLGILVKNGLQGLVIVLLVLFIFLDWKIAFWTAVGIPVAFLATLAVMFLSGQSINMISMFALIMMLGIIVDDAIVVGEHTATLQSQGYSPQDAAEIGGSKMLMPVLAAMLTTLAAFFPIFLISDRIGDIMSAIPLVVTAVL